MSEYKAIHGKDGFFDMLMRKVQEHKEDDTVSFVCMVVIHANGMDVDEDGMTLGAAPVSFTHNGGESIQALYTLYSLAGAMLQAEHETAHNATKQ